VSPGRGTAVAIALVLVGALAAAGCGLGPGASLPAVRLTVTRDFGSRPLLSRSVGDVTEADTAMRVLERGADIATRYGGGFVQSIDGVESGHRGGHPFDWFFYVNGVESTVGAAAYALHGGESVWWDYRDWSAAESVPAVVGSWPEPFADGYEGRRRPVEVECLGAAAAAACAEVRNRLRSAVGYPHMTGINHSGTGSGRGGTGGIQVLVGPWAQVRKDPAAAQIEAGPQASGVFAKFAPPQRSAVGYPHMTGINHSGSFALWGLGEDGRAARAFGPGAGLVAATRRGEDPPTWVVTGATAAGARAAAGLLDAADLRDHYAVAVEAGKEAPLPLREP
jgi:Domain of unknown function (DUF4430)